MKNLVIGLFVLGLTSLGFSQNKKGEVKEVNLNDVVITVLCMVSSVIRKLI